jgi:7-cyano-7-deazaguanine synthase
MYKTVVVLSGGMDSVTLLHRVASEVSRFESVSQSVKAISFNYGQRHSKELDSARENCAQLGIEHKVVDLKVLQELLGGSALTDDIAVPEGHYAGENMKVTVVPNRNSIMANIAIGWAVSLGFDRVALGVHSGDHAIYPDCRPVFIKALAVLSDVANYKPIDIYAPYLFADKTAIIAEGRNLGVKYETTWTCYKGGEKACGKCGSCTERREAFQSNGIEDPLEYEEV